MILLNCGVGELLRVPWTARRSNQPILKISPECSMGGMMLKLKLQYFGYLMRRTDSLEKILVLGKIEGRRRRGRQRMRWLDGITDSMDMCLRKFQVGDGQGGLACCSLSFPASVSFPMSCFFSSGGQNVGASASISVLPMNVQGLFPLGLSNLILSK